MLWQQGERGGRWIAGVFMQCWEDLFVQSDLGDAMRPSRSTHRTGANESLLGHLHQACISARDIVSLSVESRFHIPLSTRISMHHNQILRPSIPFPSRDSTAYPYARTSNSFPLPLFFHNASLRPAREDAPAKMPRPHIPVCHRFQVPSGSRNCRLYQSPIPTLLSLASTHLG